MTIEELYLIGFLLTSVAVGIATGLKGIGPEKYAMATVAALVWPVTAVLVSVVGTAALCLKLGECAVRLIVARRT